MSYTMNYMSYTYLIHQKMEQVEERWGAQPVEEMGAPLGWGRRAADAPEAARVEEELGQGGRRARVEEVGQCVSGVEEGDGAELPSS